MYLFQKICFSSFIFLLKFLSTNAQQPVANFFDDPSVVENWLKENNVPCLGIGILRESELREIRVHGEIKKGTPAPYNTIFRH